MLGIAVDKAACQVQIENETEESVTFALGGDLVVVRPGGSYRRIIAPLEPSRANSPKISEALAAVAKSRVKRST
jgi:hypothetical protein